MMLLGVDVLFAGGVVGGLVVLALILGMLLLLHTRQRRARDLQARPSANSPWISPSLRGASSGALSPVSVSAVRPHTALPLFPFPPFPYPGTRSAARHHCHAVSALVACGCPSPACQVASWRMLFAPSCASAFLSSPVSWIIIYWPGCAGVGMCE